MIALLFGLLAVQYYPPVRIQPRPALIEPLPIPLPARPIQILPLPNGAYVIQHNGRDSLALPLPNGGYTIDQSRPFIPSYPNPYTYPP